MFDTKKFGGYLSRMRKRADMTQSEVADHLNVTRQAISRYEHGDSFPDVTILVLMADLFGITLDELISSGEPTRGESAILGSVARGEREVIADHVADVVSLAPILKPSVLSMLSASFATQGIDITYIVDLAEYLNDENVLTLLEHANFDSLNDELLKKLMPLLDNKAKQTVFEKILGGEMDWHFIEILLPYAEYLTSQIEAAVIEGALPNEALDVLHRYFWDENGYKGMKNG